MDDLQISLPLGGFVLETGAITVRETYSGELISIAVVRGASAALVKAFKKSYGALPNPNEMLAVKGGHVFWTGQNQYMLLLDGLSLSADLEVATKLGAHAYTTLQSDAWACISISGDKVMDALERFIPLDLHRANIGYTARTAAHHIAVIVIKDGESAYRLLTPRTSARAFLDGLLDTIAHL